MRRRTARFALLAVLLHAFAPLLASAAPRAAVDHVELCTALGVVTVEVESGTVPQDGSLSAEHCAACTGNTAAASAAPAAILPVFADAAAVATLRSPPRASPASHNARPRAPPQHS